MDHNNASGPSGSAMGHTGILSILDVATGYKMTYLVRSKSEEETTYNLKRFKGRHKVVAMYCDRAPELAASAANIGAPCDHSIPGRSQTNSLTERCNHDINRGTRAALVQAGFPPAFWHLACQHYCMMDNTTGPESPWYKKNREYFDGLRIPFGAKVHFMPTPTSSVGRDLPKMAPSLVPGVFVGYEVNVGGRWTGGYLCIARAELDGLPLLVQGDPKLQRVHVQATKEVRLVSGVLEATDEGAATEGGGACSPTTEGRPDTGGDGRTTGGASSSTVAPPKSSGARDVWFSHTSSSI